MRLRIFNWNFPSIPSILSRKSVYFFPLILMLHYHNLASYLINRFDRDKTMQFWKRYVTEVLFCLTTGMTVVAVSYSGNFYCLLRYDHTAMEIRLINACVCGTSCSKIILITARINEIYTRLLHSLISNEIVSLILIHFS